MSRIRILFSRIAKIAITATAMAPSSTAQSSSGPSSADPIIEATHQHNWIFAAYIFSGFLVALMTYLVARSGNKVQDAIRANADARIAEARAEGAKANERAEKLENDNLKLTGEVAGLQTAASNAKAAQQRVELELSKQGTELSRQKELTAKAEKEVFELRERLQPRRISEVQRSRLVAILSHSPKGEFVIQAVMGNPESERFANDIFEVLKASGWPVNLPDTAMYGGSTPAGIGLLVKDARRAPAFAGALQQAFFAVGIPIAGVENPAIPDDNRVILIVGTKP